MREDRRPVRRISHRPSADPELDTSAWPFTLPPVAQLLRDGLDCPPDPKRYLRHLLAT